MEIWRWSARCGRVLVLLALSLLAPAGWAAPPVNAYNIQVLDGGRSVSIGITVEGELDGDFPPPRVASHYVAEDLDALRKNPFKDELLYAEMGYFSSGLFKRVRGDLGIAVNLRKSGASGLDVRQIHAATAQRMAKDGKASAMGTELVKSTIVSISGRQYSCFESGRNEASEFYAMYELPLTSDHYVQFVFHFVSNDHDRDPALPLRAHAMIDRIMQSVSINDSDLSH